MVPGSDFCGSVAPISFLPYFITPSPSHTYQKKIKKAWTNEQMYLKKEAKHHHQSSALKQLYKHKNNTKLNQNLKH
jgi:hypothetical protein